MIFGFEWGVEGAAVPTLVSRIAAAAVILKLLCNKERILHIPRPVRFHFDKILLKQIFHIAVPYGLESSMFQLGKILVLSLVSGFGTAAIAANAIGNYVAMFAILLAIPLILFIYGLSDEAGAYARQVLICHSVASILIWPLSFTLPQTLRAASDVAYPLIIAVVSMWVFRVILSYVLGLYMEMGLIGVWLAMIVDWIFRSICFTVRYRRKKWQTKSLNDLR